MDLVDFDSIYGVYKIESPNGSCYIGMTSKSFYERWNGHLTDFRLGKTICSGLKHAFEKYGTDAMIFDVLEDMTGYGESDVLHRERLWWLRYRSWGVNLYNGEPTGRGAVRHTEETRRKIGESNRIALLAKGWTPRSEQPCDWCEMAFVPRGETQKFCSKSCSVRYTNSTRNLSVDESTLIQLFRQTGGDFEAMADLVGCTSRTIYNLTLKYGLREARKLNPDFNCCEICGKKFPYRHDKLACSATCSKMLKIKRSHNRWHVARDLVTLDCDFCSALI